MSVNKLLLLTKYLLITIVLYATGVQALPPEAPDLQDIKIEGLQATAQWTDNFSQVDGYRLLYADSISIPLVFGVIELDISTTYQSLLQNGDEFYVAIQAYNADGNSELSNIEHFKLDKKIVVLLPHSETEGALDSSLTIKAGIEEALADGLWDNHDKRVRWEIVDTINEIEELKTLYFGDLLHHENVTKHIRGYIEDPDVLAVVTSTTAASLALLSKTVDNPPLTIAGTATSTILEANDHVMMMPASNKLQADKIYQQLSKYSETENRLLKYAVVVDTDIDIVVYSFDLYLLLLHKAFHEEISIQEQVSETGDMSKPFAQLVGTLVFDGSEEQAELLVNTLDVLTPDVVIHIGFPKTLKTLYDKRPELAWIGSDGRHDYKDYQDSEVMVLALEGENAVDKTTFNNHGYDIVGFLAKVLGELNDLELNRERVLQKALETIYVGRTGTKGFVEDRGSYNMLKATPTDWEKID